MNQDPENVGNICIIPIFFRGLEIILKFLKLGVIRKKVKMEYIGNIWELGRGAGVVGNSAYDSGRGFF